MSTNGSSTSASISNAPGIFLWAVVICALLYGVVETLTKVPALFGA
jgi:hypothetical protein